ncbi:MAG: hypothetical protein IIZ67_05360 [Bacilli bacterium]|nr:hypothetical protein [Bacilli bacterium]
MEQLIDIITNNGIGVACVIYFMYFNSTSLKSMTETMNEVKQSLILFNERLQNIEEEIKKKGDK